MRPQCVVCSSEAQAAFEKNGIVIYRCVSCEHAFALPESPAEHVESVYGDDYFFGGKQGYPNYLEESVLLRKRGRKYARRVSRYTEPGLMLDVGAAAGFLLDGFREEGWSGVGVEPNPGMVQYGREQLGLDLRQGTLEDLQCDEKFDLVSMIQVVPHFGDIRRAFDTLKGITRPGALVLVESWNEKSLTAKIFGERWHEYSPPSVLHWFTPAQLGQLLAEFGFRNLKTGRTLKWISLRHALSLGSYVFGNRSTEYLQSKVSPSLAVPYPSEDLFWGIYQKDS